MVIIRLTNTEAKEFKATLQRLADKVQGDAVKNARTTTPSEELQINACFECFVQITKQLSKIPKTKIYRERVAFNQEYQKVMTRQSIEN